MEMSVVETLIRRLGGLIALMTLVIVLAGIWRGTRHAMGRAVGQTTNWLRSPVFYLFSTVLFLVFSILFWRPLPLVLSPAAQIIALTLGAIFYVFGMTFVLWGRLALGKMYFVSTSLGAQLFANHQLVTHGPFAIVRHPMYLGLISAALGGLLIYQTWTTVFFAVFSPFVLMRARREERALSAEFGPTWQEYCRRVPAIIPFWRSYKP
ncbi:MAG: isoprenylcysteine carboxylmethyltransferase family protein [Chloroflexi bacterium]|nr:isoprenylcysteine carboxylmethyltransferase family protein [Chloroflexota bacterium]